MASNRRAVRRNRVKLGPVVAHVKSKMRPSGRRLRGFVVAGNSTVDALRRQSVAKLSKETLGQLDMTPDAVERALIEVARRHAGEQAPHHTLYGTFVEISLAIKSDIREFRNYVIENNLRVAIFAAAMKIEGFHGIDKQGVEIVESFNLSDLPLKKGAKLPDVPWRSRFKSDEAFDKAIGSFCDDVAQMIDGNAIIHRSDLKIDGVKYTDRAATFRLKDGREIMLFGEEYKARYSSGGEAQSALRIDRITKDPNVKPTTEISGVIDDPEKLVKMLIDKNSSGVSKSKPPDRVVTEAQNIRFNMLTFTQDQTLIKATSGDGSVEYKQIQRSLGYIRRKRVYDSIFRKGGDANEGLYRYLSKFPSQQIHALIRKLE